MPEPTTPPGPRPEPLEMDPEEGLSFALHKKEMKSQKVVVKQLDC